MTLTCGTERATAAEFAAAWPAFHRAGRHLLAAITTQRPGEPVRDELRRPPAVPAVDPSDIAPELHLSRAADLLSAAADLLASRDRRALSQADWQADAAYACGPLLTGAYLVADATLRDPAHLQVAAWAVTAVRDWTAAGPTHIRSDIAAHLDIEDNAGTLADASTLPSASPPLTSATSGAADLPALLTHAVHDWSTAALAASQLPTVSSLDLRGSARAAGTLLAVSQLLLRAYPDRPRPAASLDGQAHQRALKVTVRQIQQAGQGWNAAANWGAHTTGTPADPALLAATSQLDQAISLLGRTGPHWAHPHQIARRADGDAALAAARGALAAVQSIAEQHTLVVLRLVQTGGVYAPATQLTPTIERLADRLAHRYVPITNKEGRTLTEIYTQLGDSTAAARLAYTHLTNPTHRSAHRPEQLPAAPSAQHQLVPGGPATARPSVQPQPVATTLAGQRWQRTCQQLDPRLLTDPHWLALAGALDRVDLAGTDVTVTLTQALAGGALPARHPARELHYRLVQACSAAATPYTNTATPSLPPSRPSPPAPATPSPIAPAPRPRR